MRTLISLVALGALALGMSCTGVLYVEVDPCEGIVCAANEVCERGVCIPDGPIVQRGHCNPLEPEGDCPEPLVCVNGVCYSATGAPGPCAPGVDGWCEGLAACIAGACVPITGGECSDTNTSGVCPDGAICQNGWCWTEEPSASTACSASAPNGVCPTDEVCIAGTCTPISADNACSVADPTGLCFAGAACVDGDCIAITSDNGCSFANRDGLCPGGARCQNGLCVQTACQDGGYLCGPSEICANGACVPLDCDLVHPDGICDPSTSSCEAGICVEPSCSPTNPSGFCPPGFVCRDGSCDLPDCSTAVPNGWCPQGQICDGTACVEGPCAPDNLDGTCSGQVETRHPTRGSIFVDAVCCDASSSAAIGCQVGSCAAPLCSSAQPDGACPFNQYCNAGTCTPAPCGPYFQTGSCDPGFTCRAGQCVRGDCATQTSMPPDDYCAPDICDLTLNICRRAACSAQYPNGACPVGQACLPPGSCGTPACSAQYPGGSCPAGQICAGGSCIDPPCSSTFPTGACGPNFECIAGSCELAPCSATAPNGACAAGERCVSGGCVVYECSATFPTGPCPIGTLCTNEVCVTPPCSSSHPGGACGAGDICSGGTCVPQPCSSSYPSGACGTGFVCSAGSCVPAPCSASVPNGACSGGQVCVSGTCVIYACGADFPNGPCPLGQVCMSPPSPPTCQVPPCSAQYIGGACPSPQICVDGTCVTPACSGAVPNGACPASQVCCDAALAASQGCSVGTCVPDACSPTAPNGRCPAGESCCNQTRLDAGDCASLGSCYATACSASNPSGDCPVGQVCQAGACSVPACSATYPGGACPANQICTQGACVPAPCSASYPSGACGANYECVSGACQLAACSAAAPAGACPSGQRCVGGACAVYQCSAAFPSGPCPVGTLCQSESCVTPACSASYPGGACPAGQICSGGSCIAQPCSSTYPSGACSAGFVCSGGTCTPAACSPSAPNGTCPAGEVCCDAALAGGGACTFGQCVPYTCGAAFPSGPCPVGEDCISQTCQVPACSPQYIGGACPSPEVCVSGACELPACSAAVPNGACPASQVCCDSALAAAEGCTVGTCVLDACSVTAQDGRCPSGEVCCSDAMVTAGDCSTVGACFSIVCSAQFPYGACIGADAGKVCVSGVCTETCGATYPLGWCPGSFACVEAGCASACAGDADCDEVADAHENVPACAAAGSAGACAAAGGGCLWHPSSGACFVDTDADGSPDAFDRDADGDLLPDSIEAGDFDIATAPADRDSDGLPNLRDLDSDGDHISDTFEAGPAPAVPRDSNGDGVRDFLDDDSDGDGVLDACEVADGAGVICSATGIVDLDSGLAAVLDSDADGISDYRDTDSDADGILDALEARSKPSDATTFSALGVDHDDDGLPDYRDPDADADGVADIDEDVDGDGTVNCQIDGSGSIVADPRPSPACDAMIPWLLAPFSPGYVYDYNPGCPVQKCLLAESSRVHPDSDGDGIPDGDDGNFLVCSTANLKPINLFYSQDADYAFALERDYTSVRTLMRGGSEAGITFDDSSADNGSYAVSGFLLTRLPGAAARAATDPDPARQLIVKAIAQETADRALYAGAPVSAVSLVINRNFSSFDGYGVLVSRYSITTSAAVSTASLRDTLAGRLDAGVTGFGASGGPSSTLFTFITETLYRYDDGVGGSAGAVVVVGALVPTSSPAQDSYNYRGSCGGSTFTYVPAASNWRVFEAETAGPPAGWNTIGFNDATWTNAAAPITCADVTGADPARCGQSIYMRQSFTVASPNDAPANLTLRLDYDDGFEVYLNGTQITGLADNCCRNAPLGWDDRASAAHNSGTAVDFVLPTNLLVVGQNVIAIEMHDDTDRTPLTNGAGDIYASAELIGVITASSCSGYQIPLFFADNIASGSALAQYGDDVDALCQSLIQDNGKLDFLWVVDDSGSMGEEIGQVLTSAELFFDIMNSTEADYRVAQTTSGPADETVASPYEQVFSYGRASNRVDGFLTGDFTGAIAGRVDIPEVTGATADRSVAYDCAAENCFNTGDDSCCAACPGVQNNPACYFASRLPNTSGNGDEWQLLMGEWAIYRAGAAPLCTEAGDAASCALLSGCFWVSDAGGGTPGCMAASCRAPAGVSAYDQEQCNGNDSAAGSQYVGLNVPYGLDNIEDELEPLGCEWNAGTGACWPSLRTACGNATTQAQCEFVSTCSLYTAQAACTGAGCNWNTTALLCRSSACGALTTAAACDADPTCFWTYEASATPSPINGACSDRSNGSHCSWSGSSCIPDERAGGILCESWLGMTEADCRAASYGFCQWDAATSSCSAPRKKTFRVDAQKFAVILSDEEDCATKDLNGDGTCPYNTLTDHLPYSIAACAGNATCEANARRRLARESSYSQFYASRGFAVFSITGDKPNPLAAPAAGNGGCTSINGAAEPGATAVSVAEATGGGWGSICALDLFPTIEAIVIGALGRSSPYRLEAFIDGKAVQPIASTIKVAVEVCNVASEYPSCASGTHMEVAARSRSNGFDYDAINNTLILYGSARPVTDGDIVVSYRYWIDNPQPPGGNPSCPCPGTSAPGCACPSGQACGIEGAVDSCAPQATQAACEATAGCAWNTVLGCTATGLCEPDPTCGGACGAGEVCDPTSGLCICDVSCGGACGAGQSCDNNASCQGLAQAACTGSCTWDGVAGACVSATCGQCLCDTSCGGGCPAAQLCDSVTSSPTCGQCQCDTTCGGGCPSGQTCNSDPASSSCGFCQPPQCGSCPAGYVCDFNSGLCVCDTNCGGGCPVGTVCDGNSGSPTCGQCQCDVTCGGACPTGQVCDSNPGSASCGLCQADPTCGVGGNCNIDCSAGTSGATCAAISGCRWAPWMGAGGQCVPAQCEVCNPSVGLCVADAACCGACGPGESCDPSTGSCTCDTSCAGGCSTGLSCDADPASATCGLCLCDTSCGGPCPQGLVCDDNGGCNGLDEATCSSTADCSWDVLSAQCLSIYCGSCVVDPTCGGCPSGSQCDPTTGLCVPVCPPCDRGTVCDPTTGTCVCDQACGGACPQGAPCDSNLASPTCGQCVCDTTCGGSCPACQLCDSNPTSGSCGSCIVQSDCGGGCGAGEVCDPLSGCCAVDTTCGGGCPPGFVCDQNTGLCVCDQTCGGGCPMGTACDGDPASATCGQCLCDTGCGGACPGGQYCETNLASASCGLCVADPLCGVGGNCNVTCTAAADATACGGIAGCRWAPWMGAAGQCVPESCESCNPTIGLCVADPTCCGACGPSETCDPTTGRCECDTACGFACASGLTCDSSPMSPTCGLCLCDTTCGGSCPSGLVCDDNSACAGLDETSCAGVGNCSWDAAAGQCMSAYCGRCVIDPTCGGCPPGQECDPTTGLCVPVCPPCQRGTICDPTTGTCICDPQCGGACPLGSACDGDPASATCGQCLCDTTCGGACPACQLCDSNVGSGSCGMCVVDQSCGGGCGTGEVCDPLSGCCIADPNCGGNCPSGWICDPLIGICVPDESGG